ncbi:uncharacterized protein LOC106151483 [Lingula anatina]|uniref:Uncharacterized protein LOC106151483 n=1 Tax=Lingula anatina TaxID=7574 RepID=A0A1S3H4Z6_LINAN|nr:uncharacterized protein LOC106151483 [Lingula anatina]|eukprot:XP_013380209.1 uncharacterized protein LOC106151483 [Lingula anatina]
MLKMVMLLSQVTFVIMVSLVLWSGGRARRGGRRGHHYSSRSRYRPGSFGVWHPSGQCDVSQQSYEVYDHTFVFIMDGKHTGEELDPVRFLNHHRCAGRLTNESIIEEGKKAVQFFEEGYGLDLSNVTDSDFINGQVPVEGGRLIFKPFIVDLSDNYRLISETDRYSGKLHKDVPVSDAGWMLSVEEPLDVNGTLFTGRLGLPDTFIFYADYIFQAHFRKTIIHYESRYPSVDIGGRFQFFEAALFSDEYGEGYTTSIFEVEPVTRNKQGREVLTFPKRKTN